MKELTELRELWLAWQRTDFALGTKTGSDAILGILDKVPELLATCERVAELEKIMVAARQWAFFHALHEDGEPAIGLALDGSERGLRNALAAYEAKYGDPKEENK